MSLFNFLLNSFIFTVLTFFFPIVLVIRFLVKQMKNRDILDTYLENYIKVIINLLLIFLRYIKVNKSGFLVSNNTPTYFFKGIKYKINHHFIFTRKTSSLEKTIIKIEQIYNFIDSKKKYFNAFIDVGSNLGFHSFYISKKFENKIPVLAIEANEPTFKYFKENLIIQDFNTEKIKIVNQLAYSESGKKLNFVNNMFGQNHILKSDKIKNKFTFKELTSETLYNICRNNNFLIKDSFVKIDIEGYDYHLFNCLKKIKPIGFIFEVNSRGSIQMYYKALDLFKEYLCFDLDNFQQINDHQDYKNSIEYIYSKSNKILAKDILMLRVN